MIRIVGIQRSTYPEREFIVLQNQGALRINLRGHVVLTEEALESSDLRCAHAFKDDVLVPAALYIVLYTGFGEPRWSKTKDGGLIYSTYMNRDESVWNATEGPIHILATQHSYSTKKAPALVLR